MASGSRGELSGIPPWHRAAWDRLQAARRDGRLPHALLLGGPKGLGKDHFAGLFAGSLLCCSPVAGGLPCGDCRGCVLVRAGNHPDLRYCEPESDERPDRPSVIGIEQVRAMIDFAVLRPHQADYKIIIIRPADQMNVSAANALLKTLEEPPGETILILITAHPGILPATIRSRCQRLTFGLPDRESAAAWIAPRLVRSASDVSALLSLAGGAPFTALAFEAEGALACRDEVLQGLAAICRGQADPSTIAERWLKFSLKESLYWLYIWLADAARLKVMREPPAMHNRDQRDLLIALSSQIGPRDLFQRMDKVLSGMRAVDGNANPQLLLEDILVSW
jgi:DNA polymerase-3 subunit delta'